MSVQSSGQESERRAYFRVKDEIVVFVQTLKDADSGNKRGMTGAATDAFSLSAAFSQLSEEFSEQLKIQERNHPDLAACLRLLEAKIDLVARTVLVKEFALLGQATKNVDISASGLAFDSEGAFDTGALLALRMVLPPSLLAILVKGRVVHCESLPVKSDSGLDFKVAVEFVDLGDRERELLIRHVFRKQKTDIRQGM